jgi:hypothetical protein
MAARDDQEIAIARISTLSTPDKPSAALDLQPSRFQS